MGGQSLATPVEIMCSLSLTSSSTVVALQSKFPKPAAAINL